MTTHKNEVLHAYAEVLDRPIWVDGLAGPKPTAQNLLDYHRAGNARHGKQCLAGAMMLRPKGATGSEITIACGNPQLNKMRGLVADGYFARNMAAGKRGTNDVYKLTLTAKGEKRIAAMLTREAALVEAGKAEKAAAKAGKPADAPKAPKAAKPKAAKKATSKPRRPKGEAPVHTTTAAATATVEAPQAEPAPVADNQQPTT